MLELTFGEQVKIVLNRKGMTIKELAGLIEEKTGKKMSRQNLTQRLSRDNFQEQDMRMIARILECPLQLSILGENISVPQEPEIKAPERTPEPAAPSAAKEPEGRERDITVGELLDIHEKLDELEEEETVRGDAGKGADKNDPEEPEEQYSVEELLAEVEALEAEEKESRRSFVPEKEEKVHGWKSYLHRNRREEPSWDIPEDEDTYGGIELSGADDGLDIDDDYEADEDLYIANDMYMDGDEDTELGDVNPYTGREYQTNSVRMHPERIGYVQVYDRAEHRWTDMTEWAFLGYQERKKALLGNDYEPPIYLD